jgi:hypothetical protein
MRRCGMTNIAIEREKERSIRYRIQACPGTTRLFAEFDVTQSYLLERFIELLLHMENEQDNKDHDTDTNVGGNELNAVVSEKRRGTAAASR